MAKAPAPSFGFLLRHPAHLIACGFGSGLSPFAPGTAGTVFAWITYPWLYAVFNNDTYLGIFLVLAFGVGVAACHITGRALGVTDHGSIVWDEIVPFWAVLWMSPTGWYWQLFAFFVFRFYDIIKPAPANYFDRQVKNGFGVMMDDVIAGAYTIFTLALPKALLDKLF